MKPQDSKYFLLNDFYNLDLSLHSFTVLKPYDLSNYFTYYPVEFWIFHSASPTCHNLLAVPAYAYIRILSCEAEKFQVAMF